MKIIKGDLVQLKSGSIKMTVLSVSGDNAVCAYRHYDNSESIKITSFPVCCLVLLSDVINEYTK